MNKQSLQFLAGVIVTESKMPKDAKKQLLNFVEGEATAHQIMAMLLDGEIKTIKEDEVEVLEDRFMSHDKLYENYMTINEAAMWNIFKFFTAKAAQGVMAANKGLKAVDKAAGGGALGLVGQAAAVWVTWRALGAALNKDKRKCGAFSVGAKRAACLLGAKASTIEKKIALLSKLKSQCKGSKSPDACMAGVTREIAKLQNRLAKLKQKQAGVLAK